MRRFIISVNGKSYDVAVDEVAAGSVPVATPVNAPAPVAAPAAPAAAPVEEAPAPAPQAPIDMANGEQVTAPMPGTILEVRAQVGDKVNAGDVLFILEAMKLENDLLATVSGTIASLNASKGDMVNAGDVLVVIAE